jgi:gamma-glutamyltranspeptidase/glutathione hydrolase
VRGPIASVLGAACDDDSVVGVLGARGVVAAGHRLTAGAGAAALRRGGNAFDATIAALAMACVCEPVLCAPGAGGFAMVRDGGSGEVSLLDFFAHTPIERRTDDVAVREVDADFGTATQAFHIGPAAAATPGFFDGIEAIHAKGATLALDGLVADAAAAARAGIEVTPFQHHLSTVVAAILTATEGTSALFAPDGHVVAAGDVFRNPGLADALEILAAEGFRGSDVGRAWCAAQLGRGHVTAADLDAYQTIERAPLTVRVGGSTVHLNPLPAAGGTLVAHTLDRIQSSEPVAVARAIAATGDARRRVDGRLADLATLTLRRRGTTHVSVVDAEGTACAVTVSNGEGNGELVDGFGFMLNNILGEEDVNPAGSTNWPTNTRLSSMMCPTVIEHPDGSVTTLGSGGSNRIRSAVAQVVHLLCVDGVDLDAAVEAPRVHVEGAHLDFEDRFDVPTRAQLCAAYPDHRAWSRPDLFFGGVHAARRAADGTFLGVGDTRRDGVAIVV